MKVKNDNDNNEGQTVEITVYEYFAKHYGIDLTSSAYFPCLDVGTPKRPNYLPLEVGLLWLNLVVFSFASKVYPFGQIISDYCFLLFLFTFGGVAMFTCVPPAV